MAATAYSATTSQPGDPVTYRVMAGVLAGADETSPISLTQTVPTGVTPVAPSARGGRARPPLDQSVTCTTTGSSFTAGSTLPPITVEAIVTVANLTAATVRSGSTTRASSADANPAALTTMTAGTLPTAPDSIVVTPAIGRLTDSGPVTVSGSNLTGATAIEIGTSSEQQAGTPVVLLPCPGAAAAGCFTSVGADLVVSAWPVRGSPATTSVTVVTSGVAAAGNYVYADRPATPATPTAVAGIASATLSWTAPAANGSPLTGYVVTPYLAGVAQTPQSFDASATSRTFTGLTTGSAYTFIVAAVNDYGTSAASAQSASVTPYQLPGTPVITAATAGDASAILTWTAPANGGAAITAYVVTPYVGGVAQATQSFGSGTTQTVTGLTPGTGYTFRVAARNLAGTGPQSTASSVVSPNRSPSLTFPAPPTGEVGVAYSRLLTVTDGTSPFVWSVSTGTLPAGLTLNAATGLLSGTPTAAGSSAVTVRVVDASAQSATRAITLVIAAPPTLSFAPAPGEVGVAYSQQPVVSDGTGPFTWAVSAGSLPPGLSLNTSTGLVSGTPTLAGTSTVTLRATDSFAQAATRTVSIVVVAQPSFTGSPPPAGQVGVSYTTPLPVAGGTLPLTWSISAGNLPAGLSLDPSTGRITGTPTTVGSSAFTATVADANGQQATRPITLVVGAGPLVVTKSANRTTAAGGDVVSYTITVANTGASLWSGAAISDQLSGVLDDATYRDDLVASSGTVSWASPLIGWTGDIAAGGQVTITYSVRVAQPDLGNKVLSNAVTSPTLGTNCPAGGSDPRCSTSVAVAGLTIVKTAGVTTTTPGSTVHFSIVVTNTGTAPYVAATLTDPLAGVLDDATYNADATPTSGSVSFTSPNLTWTGSLAPGASATISYSVTVADPDLGDRSLTGTVVSPSAGSPCPSGNAAASCTATVAVLVPALAVTGSADVSTTTPGATVTYTYRLANTGQTAYPSTSLRIGISGLLDDATYGSDADATVGSVGFDAATSSVVWTGGLAVGATATITFTATVRDPDPGNLSLTTSATSPAAGSTCPVAGSSSACQLAVPVRLPGLAITQTADVATTTPGSVVTYTVSVTNSGQTAQLPAAFTEPLAGVLDDATYTGDASASTGTVSISGGSLGWSGNLAIGATATITWSVVVDDPDTGNRSLSSTVTSPTPGSNCAAASIDPRCSSAVTVLRPGLGIVWSVDTATTTPGSVVTYTVTVHNSGETPYLDLAVTADLTDALDDATYNNDATVSTGALVTHPDGTADWVLDLAPGASATGTISVTVTDPDLGDRSVQVRAVSQAAGSPCRTDSTDPTCVSTSQVLVPGLSITKTADTATAQPGGTVGYTVVVTNDGESTYAAATFTDDLASVLFDATYNLDATASSGTLGYTTSVLGWVGALAPGDSATITYSVTVRDPDPGDKIMRNRVVSTSRGSTCAATSTDPACTATVAVTVPGLTITTSADRATTAPGQVVTASVVVHNSGQVPYDGAAVTASLAGVLDDATYNGDATATSGTVSFSAEDIAWNGSLAPGATATVTYTVTVRPTDVGDNVLSAVVLSSAAGSNCTVGSTDERCVTSIPVAFLHIEQHYAEATTTPGSQVHLSATFTNTGAVPYTGITISSPVSGTVDDAIANGDQSATSGSLTLGATAITWTGNIPVGATVTVTGSLTVKNPDPGDHLLTGRLVSAADGSNCDAGSVDTDCVARLRVLEPGLVITKSADTSTVEAGGVVGYTITVENTGETAYTAATVTDPMVGVLDDAAYNNDASADLGSVGLADSTLTWVGDLAPGQTATITYTVTVDLVDGGDRELVNVVESTDTGSSCLPDSGALGCDTVVTVLVPTLTITHTSDTLTALPGATVTSTITVTNTGQIDYVGAQGSASLSGVVDDATFDSASATSGTVLFDTTTLSWTGDLLVGQTATITYSVTINDPPSGDGQMTATVLSDTVGSNCPVADPEVRCTTDVAITEAADLTFTTTADVLTTEPGAPVTYTLTATNSTGSPMTSVSVIADLAGVLDDSTYQDDATATSGDLDYTAPNLTWTGDVPADATVTITLTATVHASITGDQVLIAQVSSASVPASDNCLSTSIDPRCTSTVPVARLAIATATTETTSTPGSVVHLTETFTNTGQVPYEGISVRHARADVLDDATPVGAISVSTGSLAFDPDFITWTGSIPVGGTVTIVRQLGVHDPDLGNQVVRATLVSTAPGNNCPADSPDPACTFSSTVLTPGLTVTKTPDRPAVVPGGVVGYTITVANTGETEYDAATVTDQLNGVLDDAAYNGDASTDVGTVSLSGSTLTWSGDLTVGALATITYTLTANPLGAGSGDKALANSVISTDQGSTCPPAAASLACHTVVVVLTPALTITAATNRTQAAPGENVVYTIVARNTGQTAYPAASLDTALAGLLDDGRYADDAAATSGTVSIIGSAGARSLHWSGALAPGASVTITYSVLVDLRPVATSASPRRSTRASPAATARSPGPTLDAPPTSR